MDSKQPVETFMRTYFRARTANCRKELKLIAPLRKKFYAADCTWDSRRGTIERSESEVIVAVSSSDSEATVITSGFSSFRLRYHLRPGGQSWLIHCVEFECSVCHGNSEIKHCFLCEGKGWLSAEEFESRWGQKGQIKVDSPVRRNPRWRP